MTENPYTQQVVKGTDGRPIPAKVWLRGPPNDDDSLRIPVGGEQGVYVEQFKNGPLDLNRKATISFPTEAFGINWVEVVDRSQTARYTGAYDPCTVEMYDPINDEYVATIFGFVANVGANGNSLGSRLTVRGPEYLLQTIPANANFDETTRIEDVVRYVRDTFERDQQLFGNVLIPQIEAPDDLDVDGLWDLGDAVIEKVFKLFGDDFERGLEQEKQFNPNRDTLADVLNWVRETTGTRIWFEPIPKADDLPNLALTIAPEPSSGIARAAHLGGDVRLSDAAIVPKDGGINGLVLTGETAFDIEAFGREVGTPFGGKSYPVAEARVPKLIEAQDGQEFFVREQSQQNARDGIRGAAKSRLKELLDQSDTDDEELVAELTPTLRPYDGIESALDVQQARESDDPTTIIHELERVGHHAYHDDRQGIVGKTTCATSRYIQLSDITVETRTVTV